MSASFDFASLRSGRTEIGVRVRESIMDVSIVQMFRNLDSRFRGNDGSGHLRE